MLEPWGWRGPGVWGLASAGATVSLIPNSSGVPPLPSSLKGLVGSLLDMCAANARDAAVAAPLLEVRKGGREGGRLRRHCRHCSARHRSLCSSPPPPPAACSFLVTGTGPAGAAAAWCAAAGWGGPRARLQGAASWDDGEGGEMEELPRQRVGICGSCVDPAIRSHRLHLQGNWP